MNYKDRFYANYVSTHILPRESETTLDEFERRSVAYQKQFGGFLGEDKNVKIVDAGCGSGSLVWWLQKRGFLNVEGIDISPEQVEEARRLGVQNVMKADLRGFLGERQRTYDFIFLRDVLEHFEKSEILEVLDICFKSLNDRGGLIIQAPNAESPFGGRVRHGDFTHEVSFTGSSLSQVLRVAGFSNIRMHSVGPPVYGLKSMARLLMWKVIEAFYRFLIFVEIGRGSRIVSQAIIAFARKD